MMVCSLLVECALWIFQPNYVINIFHNLWHTKDNGIEQTVILSNFDRPLIFARYFERQGDRMWNEATMKNNIQSISFNAVKANCHHEIFSIWIPFGIQWQQNNPMRNKYNQKSNAFKMTIRMSYEFHKPILVFLTVASIFLLKIRYQMPISSFSFNSNAKRSLNGEHPTTTKKLYHFWNGFSCISLKKRTHTTHRRKKNQMGSEHLHLLIFFFFTEDLFVCWNIFPHIASTRSVCVCISLHLSKLIIHRKPIHENSAHAIQGKKIFYMQI